MPKKNTNKTSVKRIAKRTALKPQKKQPRFLHADHVRKIQHTVLYAAALFIHFLWALSGYSGYLFQAVPVAHAATFSVQTGNYVGTGASKSISGLGFSGAPDLVMIKADSAAGRGVVWKSSSLGSSNSNVLDSATADFGSAITSLDSANGGGFTISTDAGVNQSSNSAITRYKWIAFKGSDCSSSGTFCVGSYTGNGGASQSPSTGFQPDFVFVKAATTAGAGVWRSSNMATGTAAFFAATANDAASSHTDFYSLNSTGFTVSNSALVNTNAVTYYFVAFKSTSGAFNVGSYAGNGTSQNVTTTGMNPNFVMVKGASTTAAVFNATDNFGDSTSFFTNTANATTHITALGTGQFSVGAGANANTNLTAYQYIAFAGVTDPTGSGTFSMATGSYTGNATDNRAITGVGFRPDLVIIKSDSTGAGIFRTSQMATSTVILNLNSIPTYNMIKSIDSDGFTVGTQANVNTNAAVYRWQAFGNAFKQDTGTGAADFAVGSYYGNALARSVTRVPFTPDLVGLHAFAATWGLWKTSSTGGTVTQHFSATADIASGAVSSLDTNGFTLGTDSNANTNAVVHFWFAFKSGTNFKVGSYTGSAGHSVTGLGFQPDLIWIKQTGAVSGIHRSGSIADANAQYFTATANATSRITTTTNDGFTVGNNTESDSNGVTYRYAAWHAKTYAQTSFRFFANANSADVGSALASTDVNGTLTTNGQAFRLRQLVHASSSPLYLNGLNFKLQYVDKGSGTCASPSGGTPASYTDVTNSTLIAYNTGNSPSDDAALTANASDPTKSNESNNNESYQSANNFTNNIDTIVLNNNGKWDFALIDNGTPASSNYCFRAVKSDGTLLDNYPHYPMITMVADKTAPTISSTAPATNAYINSITGGTSAVNYTLSEAIASGSITMTRTSGTADGSSPHTCTLKGTALNTGAHTALDLSDTTNGCTSAQSLVNGTVYTFAFNATDAAGNSATTVTNTGVTFDTTAPSISSTAPASSAYFNNYTSSSAINYTLSEAALAGTGSKITFTRTGGTADASSPHTCQLVGTALNSGAHTALDLSNTTNGCNASPAFGSLVSGTIYTIAFDAKDLAGNTATTVSNTSVTFDNTAPSISSTAPASSAYFNNYTSSSAINYTLSEAALAGTGSKITFTRTGGTADASSPHTCQLVGTALNSGAHTALDLSNTTNGCNASPAFGSLVSGTIYTVAFDETDLAGNTASTVSNTSVTFDNVAPTISSTAPATNAYINSITGGTSAVNYTLSEAIASGSITMTRTSGTADGSSPHTCTLKGTALNTGAHTALDLSDTTNGCTSAQSLVSGTIYSFAFAATDAAGNNATTITNTNITFDNTAPVISSTAPATNATISSITGGTSAVNYTLSEAIASGSITMTGTGGGDLTTHTCTLTGTALNTGTHTALDMSDMTNGCTVAQSLTNGAVYTFAFNGTDQAGNAATTVTNTNVTFSGVAAVLGYVGSGYLISNSIDVSTFSTVVQRNALRMSWNQNLPSGCTLTLKVQGTNTGPTPDYSTSTAWASETAYSGSGSNVAVDLSTDSNLQGKRFFRYRADMTNCSSNAHTPALYDVQIDFE